MTDPLAQIVTQLRPSAPFAKLASASGPWRVRREGAGLVFYSLTLIGSSRLEVDGQAPITLTEGDFVLVPAATGFTQSSLGPLPHADQLGEPVTLAPGIVRIGDPEAPIETQQLLGHCVFGAPDAALLVTLLPRMLVVKADERIAMLVRLLADEARARRPGRDIVLERLIEVLLIEALRAGPALDAPPGLLRGLRDARIAPALQAIHADPARAWTVSALASRAALSRSAFFARFEREVGVTPMAYLTNWRMSLAKDGLRRGGQSIAEIARSLGYGSASAFSTAFAREVGQSPALFARTPPEPQPVLS